MAESWVSTGGLTRCPISPSRPAKGSPDGRATLTDPVTENLRGIGRRGLRRCSTCYSCMDFDCLTMPGEPSATRRGPARPCRPAETGRPPCLALPASATPLPVALPLALAGPLAMGTILAMIRSGPSRYGLPTMPPPLPPPSLPSASEPYGPAVIGGRSGDPPPLTFEAPGAANACCPGRSDGNTCIGSMPSCLLFIFARWYSSASTSRMPDDDPAGTGISGVARETLSSASGCS